MKSQFNFISCKVISTAMAYSLQSSYLCIFHKTLEPQKHSKLFPPPPPPPSKKKYYVVGFSGVDTGLFIRGVRSVRLNLSHMYQTVEVVQ